MKYIKLSATNSTNDFLRVLCQDSDIENYTCVTADLQINGRGQMGTKWESEVGKNLMASVLVKLNSSISVFDLNVAVALAIYDALLNYRINALKIKWANDILSGNKKIAGILIENVFKPNGQIFSIIGFGINVNQTNFIDLPNASSLKNIMNTDFDKEELLNFVIHCLKKRINQLHGFQSDVLWNQYNFLLFKKGQPCVFETANSQKFMGIIKGVSSNGKLQVLLDDDSVSEFEVKEIRMLY